MKTKENTKGSKESKISSLIMESDTIEQRISKKRDRLCEIHASIAVYGMSGLSQIQRIKGRELEDRLQFRILQAEEQLLDDKIDIYSVLLKIIKR